MRRTRRLALCLTAVLGIAGGALPLHGALPVARAAADDWPAFDGVATGQFRSWVIDDGEFIWTNGIFQARGANTDGLHHEDYWGALATGGELPITSTTDLERHLTWGAFGVDRFATDGDQELPLDASRWPAFTGELAEFRLAAVGAEVFLRLRYTSMPAPDSQIATVAFATRNASTAASAWPHGAGVRSAFDVAVTTWGTGGTVAVAGKEPVALSAVGGEVRVGDHTVDVRLPRALLPGGPWVVTGGAGLTDPSEPSTYWAVPSGAATADRPGSGSSARGGSPVWSLLFADDDPWVFTARTEGDLLVDGDVSAASIDVDPAALAAGRSVAPPTRFGRLARQYSSAFDFGDGITKGAPAQEIGPLVLPPEVPLDDVARSFEYTGRLQPYGMLVDAAYEQRTEPWPLIVYLHGLNNFYYEPFGTLPNLELVGERGYLFAGLLGRGDLSYSGRGELDVREVIADIRANYDVDPDRIHVMGHSMGSIGSHHLATRNPDWFASGSPSEITGSDALLGNLRHVPWSIAGGVGDFLDLGASSEEATYGLLSDLGYDATFYSYTLKTHESSSIYDRLSSTLDLFDRTRRVANPAEVTFSRLPDDDHPELGIVHDSAYQVSAMRFADPSRPQSIDLETFAIAHRRLDPANAQRLAFDAAEGGPSGRDAGTRFVTVPAFGDPVEVRNAGTLVLDNVAAVTLAADRLGWSLVPGWELGVTSDVPSVLSLATARRVDPSTVRIDGVAAQGRWRAGALVIEVPAGDHVLTLHGAGRGSTAPGGSGAPLPVTGGGSPLIAFPLVGLLGAIVRRRARPTQA